MLDFIEYIILGIFIGALVSLILKKTKFYESKSLELYLVFLGAYFSYMVPYILQFSGIGSTFFYGITTRHYSFYNLSETSKKIINFTFSYDQVKL